MPSSRRHLRVYHELDPTYYTATSKTFIGSIYKLFGFKDIADAADSTGGGYPQLSAEYIIQRTRRSSSSPTRSAASRQVRQ